MPSLAADLLPIAQRLNAYFAARLGHSPPFTTFAPDSEAFAAHIAGLQDASRLLLADGILGPKTRAYLEGSVWLPEPEAYLIVNGVRYPTPFATVTFEAQAGLSFLGTACWQPRDTPSGAGVDLCVLHWDECISSTHCFGVLLQRGLSVHLMLDADGVVYQALDLAQARAWHARIHNERSVGIEIQNALTPREPATRGPERAWVEEALPHTGACFGHTDFTPAQKATLTRLVPWLCDTLGIAQILPKDAQGRVHESLCPQPFAGVVGHYHLQTDKVDPGALLWPLLNAALSSPTAMV